MKKIFITTLLFFIALSILASAIQRDLQLLLKDQTFDLAYGIELPKDPKPFNKFDYADMPAYVPYKYVISETNDGHIEPYKSWYEQDFASDPFDGKIEVFVMGEPLPSASQIMILTLGVLAILLYCRNTKWKQLKTQ